MSRTSALALRIREIICNKTGSKDELVSRPISPNKNNDDEKYVSKTKEQFENDVAKYKTNYPDKVRNLKEKFLIFREWRRHMEPSNIEERNRIKQEYLNSDRYVRDFNSDIVTEHDILNMIAPSIFQYQYSFNSKTDNCFLLSHIYDRSLYCHIVAAKAPECNIRGSEFFQRMVEAYHPDTFDNIMGDWVYGHNLDQVNKVLSENPGMDIHVAVTKTWTADMARRHGFPVSRVVRYFYTFGDMSVTNNKRISECLVAFSRH